MAADEDPIVQLAIQESINDQIAQEDMEKTQKNLEDDQMSPTKSSSEVANVGVQARSTIDDMIKDLALRKALEMPVVHDRYGDTYVYIDAPPKQPEQGDHAYECYLRRCSEPVLIKSQSLLTLNSQVIAKMFGPTEQYRTLRRRKLVNKLPMGVRYVIDLTPPTEGEEAVWLTASLCCSEGVRRWHQSHCIWRISLQQVGGEEEYSLMSPQTNYATTPGVKANVSLSKSIALLDLPPEYTAVRHRSAIERVLAAAHGADPKLDSAPKVWTTFAVARHLEIIDSPLTDYIVRWLRQTPNCFFLEVLPEVSLTIADGLQVHDLVRDTFAILVGEEALDNLRHARKSHTEKKQATFGRKKEDLPEAYQQRVEYASKAFVDRIISDFNQFVGEDMPWVVDLYQCHMLSRHTQPQVQGIIESLKGLLKDYVRGAIFKLLFVNYASVPGPDLPNDGGEDLFPRVDRRTIWCKLSTCERLLTRTFWQSLLVSTLFKGASSHDVYNGWKLKDGEDDAVKKRMQDCGCYHQVNRKDLQALIVEGAKILERLAPQSGLQLPIRGKSQPGDDATPSITTRGVTQQSEQNPPSKKPTAETAHFNPVELSSRPSSVWNDEMPWPAPPGFAKWAVIDDVDKSEPLTLAQQQQTEEKTPYSEASKDTEGQSLADRSSKFTFRVENPALVNAKEDNFFNLEAYFGEARETIKDFARCKLRYTDFNIRLEPQGLGLTNTLVCLDNEFKYLPLWAGGNDDGTNGVYNDDIPISDMGFSAPGPHVHTGTSSHTPSEFDMLSVDSDRTFNTSTATNDGFSHTLHRHRVYAADSIATSSTTSDDFTIIDSNVDADDEEEHARREVEALQRIEAAENEAADSQGLEKGKSTEEENYADLFADEEADGSDFDDGKMSEGEDQVELEEADDVAML